MARLVLAVAVVYAILSILCVLAMATSDDPLAGAPGIILGLPWSLLTGRLSALADTSWAWLCLVLALPLVVNLGLLLALRRWLARRASQRVTPA